MNLTKSLIFGLTKVLLLKHFNSCIVFDFEGYAPSDTFYRTEIEKFVFKLYPVLFG